MDKFRRNAYVLVSSIIVLFEVCKILQARWIGDFYEHAAVVRELTANLLHPSNPVINLAVDHSFFSPYALIVALFARLTSLTAIDALAFAAVLNLVFFLFSFNVFCRALFPDSSGLMRAACLLALLFLWIKPEFWSGFYSIYNLHYILPYPSTFAISCAFLLLTMLFYENGIFRWLLFAMGSAIVFIIHPNTGLLLVGWSLAIRFVLTSKSVLKTGQVLIAFIASFALCCAWPYFDFLAVLGSAENLFNEQSRPLYIPGAAKLAIALLMIPMIRLHKLDKPGKILLIAAGGMLAIYLLGAFTGNYSVGRIASGIMMCFQLFAVHQCNQYTISHPEKRRMVLSSAFLFILVLFASNFKTVKEHLNPKPVRQDLVYRKYFFLREAVSARAVILSDVTTSWKLPAINGCVVAWEHPLYNVNDQIERLEAARRFFSDSILTPGRNEIVSRYRPDYLLIDRQNISISDATMDSVSAMGETLYHQGEISLIKLRAKK
jgi:hypothetical protein